MGLPADGHPSFDKLTATQQGIASRLAKTSGSEILPFPPGIGRSPITIVAAESGIWPKSKILVVADAGQHQSWHRDWLEFGSGVNSFYFGVPAPPWGGPGRDDPPGGVCVVKPSDLIGDDGDALIDRGWDLTIFACLNALNSGTARNKALQRAQLELRSWVLADQDDQAIGSSQLSELGHYLAALEMSTVYDHVPTIVQPGHLLRPSSLADTRRLVGV